MADYKIISESETSPRASDGGSWNRMVMGCANMGYAVPVRCSIQPKTHQSAWESSHRPMSMITPTRYNECNHSDTCDTCPLIASRINYKHYNGLVVREDESGMVWILNRRDRGWAEFGYWYADWADLFRNNHINISSPRQDEHGRFWEVIEPLDS